MVESQLPSPEYTGLQKQKTTKDTFGYRLRAGSGITTDPEALCLFVVLTQQRR